MRVNKSCQRLRSKQETDGGLSIRCPQFMFCMRVAGGGAGGGGRRGEGTLLGVRTVVFQKVLLYKGVGVFKIVLSRGRTDRAVVRPSRSLKRERR